MENNQAGAPKKLYRSRSDRYIGGVAGGLAAYFNFDSGLVRIGFVLSMFFGGAGLFLYIVALLIVPENEAEEPGVRQTSMNSNLFWGVLFVSVGAILLSRQLNLLNWFYFPDIPWKTIWAICLIGLGGFLLYSQSRIKENPTAGDDSSQPAESTATPFQLEIERSRVDRKIAGICGGLAHHFKIDSTLVRLGWILGTIATGGLGLALYILLIFLFPEASADQTASDSI